MIGNPTPDFTYGFNVNLGWKNLDLTVDMMGVYGNEIYRNWGSSSYAQLNYRTEQLNRWHGEGTSNWEPLLDPSHKINQEASKNFNEDGSLFRIRNIELGIPRLGAVTADIRRKWAEALFRLVLMVGAILCLQFIRLVLI